MTVTPLEENGKRMSNRVTPEMSGRRVYISDMECTAERVNRLADLVTEQPDLFDGVDVGELQAVVDRLIARIEWVVRGARNAGKYGLTDDGFWEIVQAQGFGCSICEAEFGPGGTKMCIDHNHETGEVRGILCGRCNTGLGLFRDDPERVRRALSYLEDRGHYGGAS